MPILAALRAEGLDVVDGQRVFLGARRIQDPGRDRAAARRRARWLTRPEELYGFLRPGVGNGVRRAGQQGPLRPRQRYVEGVNAISGERCAPSARLLRPSSAGRPAFFDILHSLGYRTLLPLLCGRQRVAGDAGRVRPLPRLHGQAIALVKPGATTADIVSVWPRAEEFGFADEMAAFALQYGHGVGLAIWEKPIFSRLVSLDHPEVLEEGMVFALETYWPASDGWSAARIEEEVVVTSDGCELITKFPAEELLVAGRKYWTAGGELNTLREAQSHLNNGDVPAPNGESR